MGIRFFCPNGHKLNVKEFQAGRRGICPFCGVKIQIPLHSTRKSGKGHDDAQDGAAAMPSAAIPTSSAVPGDRLGGVAGTAPATPAAAAPGPAITSAPTPLFSTPLTATPSAGATLAGGSPTMPLTPAPEPFVPPAAPATPAAAADAIAEAGGAVWYVRPPTGGQFGPAAADVMRSWLSEGRVATDALVWREGWRDWQAAAEVFPQLRRPQSPFDGGLPGPLTTATAAAATGRKRSRGLHAAIIGILVLAVLILLGVFFIVLFH